MSKSADSTIEYILKNKPKRHTYHPLAASRRAEAAHRQLKRDQRSPKQQLAKLDSRLGKGVGAVKERARLQAQIATLSAKSVERKAKQKVDKTRKAAPDPKGTRSSARRLRKAA